ncbi:kinesin light chain 3 [Lojkania enalia]|uniref:Kinesin light chain 3 n=1 Tax=Lojkania enalia TaxID=147567 RepID=A0A9P4JWD6_9PLEO|nr:kinesin light chain 3 [Didymosphaeria enalia]
MRLLHFDHFGQLILTDFHGKPSQPYAILSHRWEKSEILFEDIASGEYKVKEDGYRKLLFCAKQAAKDKLQYFWIDTCCIKLWDRLERSRAINSMFRWYSNATKCYVFLSDVPDPNITDTLQHDNWKTSFRASRWFTRGWTLQELLAPASVEFFSYEGQLLGDKSSLEQVVHEVTRIPLTALRSLPLDQSTPHERMHWADKRETTEEEDIVYCLLGLVGVTMQANYGEGKDRAWRRLQEEVETTNGVPSIIPFSRNEYFVGQELQLATLEKQLFSNKHTTTTLAIVGPGGTGKSQLALELAYNRREKNNTLRVHGHNRTHTHTETNKPCSVFWVDASSQDDLDRSYDSIAQKLNIPGWDNEKADAKQLVKLCLEQERTENCLLIFDNIEDVNLGASGLSAARPAGLTAYLPQSKQCSVVFTTTEHSLAEQMAPQALLELQELLPEPAMEMLKNYLKENHFSSSEEQQARLLLRELSYLPLAIVQAAAYINFTGIPLQEYQSKLSTYNKHDVIQGSGLLGDRLQGRTAKNPVATTLFISLDEIGRNHKVAAGYLLLAACVAYNDIPLELFEEKNLEERGKMVQVLSKYALVTRRPEDSALDVHRLVHHALREWLQQQNQLSQQTKHTLTQLHRVFPDHSHQNRSKWRRLLPHTKYALSNRSAKVEGDGMSALLWKYAMALDSDGRYNDAEEQFVQVMETFKRVLGKEHPSTLTSMVSLASTYKNQGRWKEAEKLGVQVVETRKRVLGEEHPDTLTSMANLASTYKKQGRWKEAEELEMQVEETRKGVLRTEHPDILTSIANLASTYKNQGRWKKAEELEVQVVETCKRLLGEEHPDTLTSMANLASTYRDQGRRKEAEELEVQVEETRKRVLRTEHPNTLTSMANLASTYRDQGRWKEAEEQFMQVIETKKRVFGEEHPNTLTSMANLASTYRNQGRWKEAEELGVQVVETKKRVLGKEHPDTLTSITILASTFWNQGRWKEAEEQFIQVIETFKRVLGEEHPNTLTSMANLASTYRNQGRRKEAEELEVQVVETKKRVFGEEHPDTLISIANLASTYRDQGRWKKAEELEVQVVETFKRVLGEEHPDTLNSISNLASTYRDQKRWKEAEEIDKQVVETRKRVLGEEHPSTLTSMANLASTYSNQGGWKEAEEQFMQVIETSKRVLGKEHPDTLIGIANLASTYRDQKRWKEAEELDKQVVETRKRVLGEEHPSTLTSMANLASTYSNQGRWKEAEEQFMQVVETRKRVLGEEHPSTLTSMANLASTYKNQERWKEAEELEVQVVETRKRVLGE